MPLGGQNDHLPFVYRGHPSGLLKLKTGGTFMILLASSGQTFSDMLEASQECLCTDSQTPLLAEVVSMFLQVVHGRCAPLG